VQRRLDDEREPSLVASRRYMDMDLDMDMDMVDMVDMVDMDMAYMA
jgi:hypothetical protein